MDARSEKLIAKSKNLLTDIRHDLRGNSAHWSSHTPAIRAIVSYIESSNLLHFPHRHEEIAWFLHGIQEFAYSEPDRGGVPDLTSWCEHGWTSILHSDPYNIAALQGLGDAYLKKSQYLLSRIAVEEADMDEDEREDEHRLQDPVYADARRCLEPAVEYLGRAVDSANQQRRLTGGLLATVYIEFSNICQPHRY